jgi:uncharacterized protein YhfF/GNAT superfamily N-acetyltransferase
VSAIEFPAESRAESSTAYWRDFCRAVRLPPETPYQVWHFGDSPELAHKLVELVLNGPKRATAALGWSVDRAPETGPVDDGYSVVTEFDGTPRAVIRTTMFERRRFDAVDAQFAWDEGEGDRTLADWRAGHQAYFSRECAALCRPFDDEAPVVLERFELLYPFDAAYRPVDCGPRIVPSYLPGSMAASAALQIGCYTREHSFTSVFERERLRDIADFVEHHDGARDGVWLLVDAGGVLGSVVIDARAAVPELRWFIVADELRGRGWGRRLMAAAMAHCRKRYPRVVLHTFKALDTARALYLDFGFRQFGGENEYSGWGPTIVDQSYEWTP